MVLNDTELLVVHTIAMRLNEKESLEWISSKGVGIKRAQLYRIKAHLKSLQHEKSDTAPSEFLLNNANIWIERLETILYLSFQNVKNEKDPLKNQKILESIVRMFPTFSAYYEAATMFKKDSLVNNDEGGVVSFFESITQH